ncbi:hypothetical protein F4803DRAFT_231208 [Xylaria telfairii]|nr:hypothetical protein F4803DRAFT_231208 [Xylaria telfairii]
MMVNFFGTLFLLLTLAKGSVSLSLPTRPHLDTQYVDLVSGTVVMELLIEGYTGPVTVLSPNTTEFTPSAIYTYSTDLIHREIDPRDICVYIKDCANYLKNTAAAQAVKNGVLAAPGYCTSWGNAFLNYFTNNNYEQAKALLTGIVGNLAIAAPVGVIGYYLNARLAATPIPTGSGGNDACAVMTPATIATKAQSSMYQFCLDLQARALSDIDARYVDGDVKDGTQYPPNGEQFVAKFFIDKTEFSTADVCSDYGIVWRRDFEAALKRGARRLAMM